MLEVCKLCNREFETDGMIPIPSTNSRLPKMYRIDGIVHQFPIQRKKKPKWPGAFAVPRQSPVAECQTVEDLNPAIEEEHTVPNEEIQLAVEVLAEKLQEHFSNFDVQPKVLPVAPPPYWDRSLQRSDERATDLIGEIIDGTVVSLNTNALGYRTGFIRTNKYGRSRDSLFFKEEDVTTVGEIRIGTSVRCLVVDSPDKSLEAKEIEIYLQ